MSPSDPNEKPKHSVAKVNASGVSMLEAAQYPMESNVCLALLHEPGGRGAQLAVLHPGVGAPLAAGLMEEAIALGATGQEVAFTPDSRFAYVTTFNGTTTIANFFFSGQDTATVFGGGVVGTSNCPPVVW